MCVVFLVVAWYVQVKVEGLALCSIVNPISGVISVSDVVTHLLLSIVSIAVHVIHFHVWIMGVHVVHVVQVMHIHVVHVLTVIVTININGMRVRISTGIGDTHFTSTIVGRIVKCIVIICIISIRILVRVSIAAGDIGSFTRVNISSSC